MVFRSIFRKLDLLETPAIASAGTWREWELRMRAQRPVRWFLQRTLPSLSQKAWGLFKSALIKALTVSRDRIFAKYHQHWVGTGLPPGEHDAEDRLLGACFTLLGEVLHDYPSRPYGAWAKWRAASDPVFKEGLTLFWWWSSREQDRALKLPSYPELPEDVVSAPKGVWTEAFQFHPSVKEWKRIHREREALMETFRDEDRQMLARAVDVFPALVQGSLGRATPRKRRVGTY